MSTLFDKHDLNAPDHIRAHCNSSNHRTELMESDACGCFYCVKIFPPTEIDSWIPESPAGELATALCPHCGIDSVIGTKSGFPITTEFLSRMRDHWFAD